MSRRLQLITIMMALAVIISAVGYTLYFNGLNDGLNGNSQAEIIPSELLKLFVLSHKYLSEANSFLYSSLYGSLFTPNITLSVINQLLQRYKQDEKYLPLVPATGLDRLILGTYETYRNIAVYAGELLLIGDDVRKIMPYMKKTLEYLVNCNYTKAMKIYSSIRGKIVQLKERTKSLLSNISSLNTSYILSTKHIQTLNNTIKTLTELDEMLRGYLVIMEKLRSDPELIGKACIIASGKNTSIDQELVARAQQLIEKMNRVELAGLEPDKDALQSLISSLTADAWSNEGNNRGEGNGAGSYNYTETD